MSVNDLLANPLLGLQRADRLCARNIIAPHGPVGLPILAAGGVHEWFLLSPDGGNGAPWHSPLTLLAAMAIGDEAGGTVLWIGRSCWPTLKLLHDLYGESATTPATIAQRCLFIDPRTDKERFWVIEEALRCSGVRAVVADGHGMTPTISRRLQLAAEAGGARALLARPPGEARQPSWAMTRWHVRPVVSQMYPRWEIAANKGAPDAHWTVEYKVRDGKGALHIPADVGSGFGSPQRQRRENIA